MSTHDHTNHRSSGAGEFLTSRTGLVLLGFLAIAAVFLFTEHQAHLLGALFWLLPLACVLLHLFMHGGHGQGGHRSDGDRSRS